MHYAVKARNKSAIDLLIATGAKANLRNNENVTPQKLVLLTKDENFQGDFKRSTTRKKYKQIVSKLVPTKTVYRLEASFRRESTITRYKIKSVPRGVCLIFNIQDFLRSPDKRRIGSEFDVLRLYSVFNWLKFYVKIHTNDTSAEIRQTLEYVGKNVDHSRFDCFVCCVLSHGTPGDSILGTDLLQVSFQEIEKPFQTDRCPSLANKPKIFLYQACRGDLMERSADIEQDAETDVPANRSDFVADAVPQSADVFRGFATVPGSVSFRSTSTGFIFIQTLCDVLENTNSNEDLDRVFTRINRKIADMEIAEKYKQMPQKSSTLRYDVYLVEQRTGAP